MNILGQLSMLLLVTIVSGKTREDDLRNMLLSDYIPHSLPNKFTNISIRVTVLHLDLDESRQILMLDTWISMEWNDPRMAWDESQYPVGKLSFTRDEVWTPDITLYNNGEAHIADHLASILVLAFPTGKMMWVPTSTLPAACVLDMTYWPHDKHKCTVKFGSWVHSGNDIDLNPKDDVTEVEFDITTKDSNGVALTRGQWNVLESSVTRHVKMYECCPEPYVHIAVEISVERNAPAFVWLIKMPFFMLCLSTCLLFVIPPGSVHKLIFGALLLVLDMQFLSYTKETVHFSPTHTPIIIQLISQQFMVTLFSVMSCAFVVRMVRDPHAEGLPSPLKRISSFISTFLLLGNYRKLVIGTSSGSYPRSIKGEELEMSEERGGMVGGHGGVSVADKITSEQAEWLLLGAIIDRLVMLVYIVCLTVKFIRYSTVL